MRGRFRDTSSHGTTLVNTRAEVESESCLGPRVFPAPPICQRCASHGRRPARRNERCPEALLSGKAGAGAYSIPANTDYRADHDGETTSGPASA